MLRAVTADFDSYLVVSELIDAEPADRWVTLRWQDGFSARFHYLWLRDNCPCETCVHYVTMEQTFELLAVSPDIRADATRVDRGVFEASWPDVHVSRFDAGWLRKHAYSEPTAGSSGHHDVPSRIVWDATMQTPPTFDGAAIVASDDALHAWLVGLASYGCSLVQNVPTTPDGVADLARRMGPIRDTNFGLLWDVTAEPDPITNANTALPLPPHVDLPTREYQPGIQFLHCLVNEAEGGESILVDGFRLAEEVRRERPDFYEVLTNVSWDWANRSKNSDYRFSSPILVTDARGELIEVRLGNWLRAPLTSAPFDQVELAYAAYRYIFALSFEERFSLRFRLGPGDCMAFDNRRVLHARGAFWGESGRRHLRGCYTERDELYSRIRVLQRARRAAALAASHGA
jgi:gamma-butyrobetaine dioxygenase